MFQMRSESFARVSGSQHVGFETLEGRQLLSAVPSTVVVKAESIIPAETVKAAILGPSAVEGRYKGDVTETGGTEVEVKIVVTSTEAELIINGTAKLTASLSSLHFEKIRKGTFDVEFTAGKESVTVVGTVTDSGLRISGSYSTSTDASGTFAVKKYADS